MYENLDKLFTLRVKLDASHSLTIHAYDAQTFDGSHNRIDVSAVLRWTTPDGCKHRADIWKRGETWCGQPCGKTTDGDDAKALVMSLMAMKPGGADAEFFAGWTAEQLGFAERFGESLSMVAHHRYGDR